MPAIHRWTLLLALLLTFRAAGGAEPPWERMEYGPFLSTAVGLGDGVPPVHKGIVIALRTPAGEETDLRAVFDPDLLAWRCVWEGRLVLEGIVFNGPHGTFPEIDGDPFFRAPALPGVADAAHADRLGTDPRNEPWGPIPPAHARWGGLHLDGDDVILAYTVANGRHRVLERVWAQPSDGGHVFLREITVTTDGDGGDGPVFAAPDRSGTRTAPANGTMRIALARPGEALPRPARPRMGVDAAIRRARPRWGAPIVTRGIVDDALDAEGIAARLVRHPGADALTLDLAAANGGTLELVRDGRAVEAAPAEGTLVLRTPRPADANAWIERDGLGWWPSDTGHGTHEGNALNGADDLRLDGVTWRRGVRGRALDFDGTAAAWLDDLDLDLGAHDLTVAAWIHTTSDGTIFAVAPRDGAWAPDGATFFVRGGKLAFDVGWVGVVAGGPRVDDGAWHHAAATWRHETGDVRLFVDGAFVAEGELPLKDAPGRADFVPRFGWTNVDFPGVSRFSGYMDGLMLVRGSVPDAAIPGLAATTGEPIVEGTVVRVRPARADDAAPALRRIDDTVQLWIPPLAEGATFDILERRGPRSRVETWAMEARHAGTAVARPFRIDRLAWPDDNRHGSWLRFGAFDFAGPTSALIATWSGDVWRVDGLDEDLDELTWTRVATGLNQPFGLVSSGDGPLVLGRDQITRLHDTNGDGEADFLENVTNAARNSEHFHEPASGLLVAPDGSLLYHKAARHAKHALHDQHGTILRVSPDGSTTEVVARGFRAPIGLTRLPDGTLLGSDQEGHWTPANRINLIRPSAAAPPFHGNGWAAMPSPERRIERGGERVQPAWDAEAPMVPPLCWLPPTVDRSPSSQVYVDHPAWGALDGSILGLSYGTGEVYLVLREDVTRADGAPITQGGIVKLGIQLPTGLLAGRIHPETGDLYVCGLFGWSSDRTEPGGFYRVRPRSSSWSASLNVPVTMRTHADGLELAFTAPLDADAAQDPSHWSAVAWNYRRSADYGSKTYDLAGTREARTTWTVRSATLAADARTVRLVIDDFEPAMQVHLAWSIADAAGRPLEHEAFLTVNALPAADAASLVVYLVRHAEKEAGGRDPGLTAEGRARAESLADLLAGAGIEHVHSTAYTRTRTTAAPLAERLGLDIDLYDPRALATFAQRLREAGGRHVVVGHSNTTPALVARLGGAPGSPIDDASEYDRLYVLTVAADGAVTTEVRRYGPSVDEP